MTYNMSIARILDSICTVEDAVALAGCRLAGTNSESCAHDILVFDNHKGKPEIRQHGTETAIIYRIGFDDMRPSVLLGCLDIKIIKDESWRLVTFLNDIRQRQDTLTLSYARDNAAAAILYSQYALQADTVDDASCWQKCATLCLADAALMTGRWLPSSHAWDGLRRAEDDKMASLVATSLGAERATLPLLTRMTAAASGLTEMTGLESPDIVMFRSSAMQKDGRLADCYYYLCRMGRDAMVSLGGRACDQTVRFASRICMDSARESATIRKNATAVREAAGQILDSMAER